MPAPTIETARLLLRPHRPADLPAAIAMWVDPVVTRYTSGRAFSREETWARLLRYAGHWQWMEYGFWAIEEKASGEFAGELGFAEFHRELDPPLIVPEAGWVLDPRFHGRGYAHEALTAALAWADARFPTTTCLIHPDNTPSLRLAAKHGYRIVSTGIYKDQPISVFER